MWVVRIFIVLTVILPYTTATIGAPCQSQANCGHSAYEHCDMGECRNVRCANPQECRAYLGEYCSPRNDGTGYGACRLNAAQPTAAPTAPPTGNQDVCPGGTPILINGAQRQCNAYNPCPGANELCNPLAGVCCTAIHVCRQPLKPLIDQALRKPKACMTGQTVLSNACDETSMCESQTGFCCVLPRLFERCEHTIGCRAKNAHCDCDTKGACQCKCTAELGYEITDDGKGCRRIQESCTQDAECKAAFAQCVNKRCQCKSGFTADTQGGCIPTTYRCGETGAKPFYESNKIVICDKSLDVDAMQAARVRLSDHSQVIDFDSATTSSIRYTSADMCDKREKYMRDSCPATHYCVPFFDVPQTAQHYKGICCPIPSLDRPSVCPVGQPHSSSAGGKGCSSCPLLGYFCHNDPRTSSKETCCPSPCINPGDVYADGICWPVAAFGEECQSDAQCVSQDVDANSKLDLLTSSIASSLGRAMKCVNQKCACENGFIVEGNKCVRAQCTIGQEGEPLSNGVGNTIRCSPNQSGECPSGSSCDPTFGVCCKVYIQPQNNNCPQGWLVTGVSCPNGSGCQQYESCHAITYPNGYQTGVCCKFDYSQYGWGLMNA